MAQRYLPGVGYLSETASAQRYVPGLGYVAEAGSGSPAGSAPGGTGTGTGSGSGGSASGVAGGAGSAPGGTGVGAGSGSGGAAAGGATGSFISEALVNNAGALLASQAIIWTWWQGAIGAAPTSLTHGSGTTSAGGVLSVSGLPQGAGFLIARTADSSGVYYQPGTVT